MNWQKKLQCIIIVIASISTVSATAQYKQEDSVKNFSAFKRAISISGLFQVRALQSLRNNVDVNGKNFDPDATKGVKNSFALRRIRMQVVGNINDRFSANLLVNFAEFSGNPANKVLENAFIKYSLNKHFNVQAGQFRPFFGIEDMYPADFIRTFDYSNQYTAFANNNWQGFQTGLTVFGEITKTEKGQLPLKYYVGVYNGNGRNQAIDNDNTKNGYARLETELGKKVSIGVNGAMGNNGAGTGNAWGGDVCGKFKLADKWKLTLYGEYKEGTNFNLCTSTGAGKPSLTDYKISGLYFFPIVSYDLAKSRLRSIEFSSRYEYLDENCKLQSNVHQTVTPNVSFVFCDNFYAMLQLGVNIDMFKHDVALSNYYSKSLAYAQLQVRF